jgi:hypothetical protein
VNTGKLPTIDRLLPIDRNNTHATQALHATTTAQPALTSFFSFSFILSDTLRNPSLPLASRLDELLVLVRVNTAPADVAGVMVAAAASFARIVLLVKRAGIEEEGAGAAAARVRVEARGGLREGTTIVVVCVGVVGSWKLEVGVAGGC